MKGSIRWAGRAAAATVLLTLLVAGTFQTTSGAATGNQASAPGVTPTSIDVGLITSITGPAASPNTIPGFKARIDAQNAKGGIYGRKIKFIAKDDQTNPTANQTAADAELSKGVFAIDDNSAVAYGAAQTLTSQGVPVVGGGFDGPEWTEPQYANMFSTSYTQFTKAPRYSTEPGYLRKIGASRFAVIGYGVSPSSSLAARNTALSLEKAGFQVPYLNDSLPLGTANVTAVALQMKAAKVDSLEAPLQATTELALITAGEQVGIKWKYVLFETGYGQEWLDNPQAVASTQGDYFAVEQVPVELHTPATIAEQAAFKKYAGFSGVPSVDWTQGWTSADLLIKGLEVAGRNPTRESFIKNLRKVTDWNAEGLLPEPVNFEHYQTPPPAECGYELKLVGHQFVPTSTKVGCSDLVPGT